MSEETTFSVDIEYNPIFGLRIWLRKRKGDEEKDLVFPLTYKQAKKLANDLEKLNFTPPLLDKTELLLKPPPKLDKDAFNFLRDRLTEIKKAQDLHNAAVNRLINEEWTS